MSKKQSSTPHDALFKLFLRQPDTARDFLAFHLPAPIHALCDMKTLKLESSSFIDDDLRESYSDVLWSVKTEQNTFAAVYGRSAKKTALISPCSTAKTPPRATVLT